jgi:hypothetical protein
MASFKPVVQNWVITPVALAVGDAQPATIAAQRWQIVATGVGIVDFQGNLPDDWRRDTVLIFPNIVDAPLQAVLSRYPFPVPDPELAPNPGFEVEQWAPYAALNSVFSRQGGTVDAGYAVDDWRIQFNFGADAVSGRSVTQVFNGLEVDIAARNELATLHRLSYQLTLTGTIVFLEAI